MSDNHTNQSDLEHGPETHTSDDSSKTTTSEPEKGSQESVNQAQDVLPEGILGRVLSRTATRISVDPGPPPDGGLRAWTQAFMGHLVVFNVWGYITTYGVFQAYYVTTFEEPPSKISWVGSTQIFLLFFIGTFSGRATDAGLFRLVYILGSIFFLIGVFMTSICTKYWQLFLAQGVCTGLGNGLLFCPTVALLTTYFTKNRALAISITASGTATGGIVFPVIFQQLLPKIGFPWTIRVIGFIMMVILGTSFAFMRTRLPPRKSGPFVEWAAFTELPYALFSVAMFLVFWALYFAFYYLPSFGRDIIQISYSNSINNLLIVNGVGLFGRIIPGYLSDRFTGPMNLLIVFTFFTGVLLFCWPAVQDRGALVAFSVLYGLTGAGIQSLFPATLTSLTPDLKKAGVRIGMVFSVVSFASLTGPPIAGALIQQANGKYIGAQAFAAVSMLVGSIIVLLIRIVKEGWKKARI